MNFIWSIMKSKLTIINDNEIIKRIATIDLNVISYTESPGIKVNIVVDKDSVYIKKSGLINMDIVHKLNYIDKINYQINLNGNEFFGNVEIVTKSLNISEKIIELEFLREGDLVYQKWEIE